MLSVRTMSRSTISDCPAGSPQCTTNGIKCIPLPNGLRFIFGRDMTNLSAPPTGDFHFVCMTQSGWYPPNGSGPNNDGLGYPDMAQALAVCSPGNCSRSGHRRLQAAGTGRTSTAPITAVTLLCQLRRRDPAYVPFHSSLRDPGLHAGRALDDRCGRRHYEMDAFLRCDGAESNRAARPSTRTGLALGTTLRSLRCGTDNCLDKLLSCAGRQPRQRHR